jgi:putative oxidoreductase
MSPYQKIAESLSENPLDAGLLFLRLGFGAMFLYHGLPQLLGGPDKWAQLGGAMAWLGLTAAPAFWGFMSGFSETVGALCLLLGLGLRPASALMAFTMLMAAHWHFEKGAGLAGAARAIEPCIVFLSLLITGPGRYRLKLPAFAALAAPASELPQAEGAEE